jgi:hypothetical protein
MSNKFFFNLFFAALTIFGTTAARAENPVVPPASIFGQPVVLESGTDVSVKLNQEIDALYVSTGNTIQFVVTQDVTAAGRVLIKDGAYAEGVIENVVSGCDGKCSKITVSVENAQAVDGQRVRLYSRPFVITAPCCDGSSAKASIGARLTAYVKNDITIKA